MMKITITVLRDGQVAGTAVSKEVDLAGLEMLDLQVVADRSAAELARMAKKRREEKE
jgi:hypothetical protein